MSSSHKKQAIVDYTIHRVDASMVRPLRHKVLRPWFSGPEECIFAGDENPESIHFAIFLNDTNSLVACASFTPEPYPEEPLLPAYITCTSPWRMRGVATAPEVRGQGLGGAILHTTFEEIANDRKGDLVYCHGRTSAKGFYEHLGFILLGDEFVTQSGPHYIMVKPLSTSKIVALKFIE